MHLKIRKDEIYAIMIIAVFYAVIQMAGITCPIRFITGISCAGCGMSRAFISLLKLDVASAFSYHPLVLLPVPVGLVLLFRDYLPKRLVYWMLRIVAVLFLGVYVIRLLQPENTIVTMAPSTGLIYQILSSLWQ